MYDRKHMFLRVAKALESTPGAGLRALGRTLGVHPHTVAELVREHTGQTFSEWKAARQYDVAMRLLATRADLSMKQIAFACGFRWTSVFDRFVRRTSGRSPSQWRRIAHGASGAGPNINVLVQTSTLRRVHEPAPGATLNSSIAPATVDGDVVVVEAE